MLSESNIYATIPVSDLERAQRFYTETLGLTPAMVTEGGVKAGKCRALKSSLMSQPSAISWLRRTASSCPGNSLYISAGGLTKNWSLP